MLAVLVCAELLSQTHGLLEFLELLLSEGCPLADATKTILVTGDFVLDHHIYEGRRHHYSDGLSEGVRVVPQVGGGGIVYQLLDCLLTPEGPASTSPGNPADRDGQWHVELAVKTPTQSGGTRVLTDKTVQSGEPPAQSEDFVVAESQRAYAFWRPLPRNATADKQVWRVSEQMGFGCRDRFDTHKPWPAAKLKSTPSIIVISEGGMGFRESDRWADLPFFNAKWIVLKTAAPIAEGQLWKELFSKRDEELLKKLVVVVEAAELRKSPARISRGLSWDATLEDVVREIGPGGALESLGQCPRLLITFQSEGALWIDRFAGQSAHFVFEPTSIEGDQANGLDGSVFGLLSCVTAAVVFSMTQAPKNPDFLGALDAGLCAMRDLRLHGHGEGTQIPMGFPAERLAKVIKQPPACYSRATFQLPLPAAKDPPPMNLVRESLTKDRTTDDLAWLIVQRGLVALENLPQYRIGDLLTVDRQECESLRTIAQMIRRYKQRDPGKKPLCLGVFGPPGAGKSFAVKQVATQLCGEEGWMEFNLSQFAGPNDLIGAFHQIRDKALQGHLPVAFFDEFDSQQLLWLQYLLAPMQDGKFQEGQVTHPIGKCVFIFAGGTSWTFESFGPPPLPVTQKDADQSFVHAWDKFRHAKGPDFKSRLDAYLDVVGPNPRQILEPSGATWVPRIDPDDDFVPIRRALMIRSTLKAAPNAKLSLDAGVLSPLLQASRYNHGSRSLEKLLQPFVRHPSGQGTRSELPSDSQIAMHVDPDDFRSHMTAAQMRPVANSLPSGRIPLDQSASLSEDDIGKLAPQIHDAYEDLVSKRGRSKERKHYSALEDFQQSSNMAAARRMIPVLGLVGLEILPGPWEKADIEEVRRLIEYQLELLAEAEHDGWMKWHLEQEWRNAKETKRSESLHRCLAPYHDLDHEDRQKDREQVRRYIELVASIGRRIAHKPT